MAQGPVNMIFSLFSMKQWNGNQKRYLKSKSEKVVPSKSIPAHSREEAVERVEILYADGGFDDEFDESTMDVSFEVKTESTKKKEPMR